MWKIDLQGNLVPLIEDSAGRSGVWVPSEQAVFHYVELPLGRQRMWEQTVPFVLEEQLIEPVEDQHFVIGRGDVGQDNKVPVAVVSLALMDSWVAGWKEKSLDPRVVCPDLFAVPFDNGKAVLWHEGDRCLLRIDAQSGFSGSLDWIQSLLQMSGNSGDIEVYSDAVEQLPVELRERAQALPCSLDDRMRMGFDQNAVAMNFLQGAFQPISVLVSLGRAWKWAGVAAIALLCVYTASLSVQTRSLDATTASLKQATIDLYRRNFQSQVSLANLRPQVNQRMDQVRRGVANRGTSLWKALSYVEPVLSACKACRVEEISLEKSSLSLLLSSSRDFDQLLQEFGAIRQLRTSSEPLADSGERKQLRLQLEVNTES